MGITKQTYTDGKAAKIFTLSNPFALITLHHLAIAGDVGVTPKALAGKLGHAKDGSAVNMLKVLVMAGVVEKAPKIGVRQPYRIVPTGLENILQFAMEEYDFWAGVGGDARKKAQDILARFSGRTTGEAICDALKSMGNAEKIKEKNIPFVLLLRDVFVLVQQYALDSLLSEVKNARSEAYQEFLTRNPMFANDLRKDSGK